MVPTGIERADSPEQLCLLGPNVVSGESVLCRVM